MLGSEVSHQVRSAFRLAGSTLLLASEGVPADDFWSELFPPQAVRTRASAAVPASAGKVRRMKVLPWVVMKVAGR